MIIKGKESVEKEQIMEKSDLPSKIQPKKYQPNIPFPQRLRKKKLHAQYSKFLDIIKQVRINVPLVDMIA